MEGTVVSITARQGQTLNTSQQAPVLMRIADLSSMKVRAQVLSGEPPWMVSADVPAGALEQLSIPDINAASPAELITRRAV